MFKLTIFKDEKRTEISSSHVLCKRHAQMAFKAFKRNGGQIEHIPEGYDCEICNNHGSEREEQ